MTFFLPEDLVSVVTQNHHAVTAESILLGFRFSPFGRGLNNLKSQVFVVLLFEPINDGDNLLAELSAGHLIIHQFGSG